MKKIPLAWLAALLLTAPAAADQLHPELVSADARWLVHVDVSRTVESTLFSPGAPGDGGRDRRRGPRHDGPARRRSVHRRPGSHRLRPRREREQRRRSDPRQGLGGGAAGLHEEPGGIPFEEAPRRHHAHHGRRRRGRRDPVHGPRHPGRVPRREPGYGGGCGGGGPGRPRQPRRLPGSPAPGEAPRRRPRLRHRQPGSPRSRGDGAHVPDRPAGGADGAVGGRVPGPAVREPEPAGRGGERRSPRGAGPAGGLGDAQPDP